MQDQYRDMLYWNHQEIVKALRSDINAYLPKILAKRRAIAVGLHKILGNPSHLLVICVMIVIFYCVAWRLLNQLENMFEIQNHQFVGMPIKSQ